jgi:hypothetical protein
MDLSAAAIQVTLGRVTAKQQKTQVALTTWV